METAARSRDTEVLEVERPDLLDVGRLRLMGFPTPYRPVLVERRHLEVRSYDDATAVSIASAGSRRRDIGGAYDAAGDLIVETERAKPLQQWWPTPRRIPAAVRPEVRYEGAALYGGRYAGHFGHILLETMTRFWADLDYDAYERIVVIPKSFNLARRRRSRLFDMLVGLLGIPADRVVIVGQEGVAFERLDVPSTPFVLSVVADPRFLDVFDRIADRVVRDDYGGDLSGLPSRVYLSRSQLDNGRPKGQSSATNEAEAEAFFEERGFTVVHPQKIPFAEQVALARNADLVAGCNGSALHLAMFCRPDTGLLALDIRHVSNQYLIDRARGLDAMHVWARSDDSDDWQTPWTLDMVRVRSAYETLIADRQSPGQRSLDR